MSMDPRLTFVVPAYRESPHLDACLWSLRNQSVPCRIIVVTSTPNEHIRNLAERHHVDIEINPRGGSIAADWNYGLLQGGGMLVTLAHQDDVYAQGYAEACIRSYEKNPSLLAVFTDYAEILGEGGKLRGNTLMLNIKRFLLLPYLLKPVIRTRFLKKAVLRFGSPICCPSVCLNLSVLRDFRFRETFTVNMDWDAWLRLADLQGPMVYVGERLCLHRIHSGSETSNSLQDSRRAEEDLRLFRSLWPKAVADVLARLYALCYRSNDEQ